MSVTTLPASRKLRIWMRTGLVVSCPHPVERGKLMSEAIVQVEHLRKEFDGTVAVADVSFEVRRGEIVGVLGPNGAGKTTTIQVLLGLTTPTSGTVRVFGKDLEKHRIEILQRCNFSSAYTGLPSNLKVWENLLVFSMIYGVKKQRQKTDELLELLEIKHLRGKITGRLSSGESTRVNLCKALLNDPELLMLDEPTASLDPDIADKVRKLLRRVQREKGTTIIYTSHNMRDVEEVCDRVLFMHKGRIIAEGTPRQVIEKFRQKSLEEVFIRVARSGDLLGEVAE
jgi:ABC-2 type transport system ATP-binding protein